MSRQERAYGAVPPAQGAESGLAVSIVTAQEFAAVKEPGADPLLGESGEAVIPEGGDVMLYGDGGASKTTLSIDLAFHLAAGDPWLEIPVPRPVRVLLIEAEGPMPLFRQKIDAKLEHWRGTDLGDRLLVWERPWADFSFSDAEGVAAQIAELEVDVLIVGPLTRVGMDELGTLQQVRDFVRHVARFRAQTGRRLTVVLVHHENKGGSVSGAWEGAGDTLLHARVRTSGKTTLTFQKARWSSRWHKRGVELGWIDGEGFEVIGGDKRDLLAEVEAWLPNHPPSTAAQIAHGIEAREVDVKAVVEGDSKRFRLLTGDAAKALDRHPTARLWEVVAGEE